MKTGKKHFIQKIRNRRYQEQKEYYRYISILCDMFNKDDAKDNKDFNCLIAMNPYQVIEMFNKIIDIGIDNFLINEISNQEVFKVLVKLYIRMNDYKV